jgi:UDP-glucose 4-epimerase
MKIAVTGGAGYIGSICVEELVKQGNRVVVIDNLQEGHREAVAPGADLLVGDFADANVLKKVFGSGGVDAVIHFAAETTIADSMENPGRVFLNNVSNGVKLLEKMRQCECRKIIFSSTAAVFGNPDYLPIDEKHPRNPINPYGESKSMFENILSWYHHCHGFKYNIFRYFNAAGATDRLGEAHRHETHLIPVAIQAAMGKRRAMEVFGSDYDTKDGTCVRDFLHVTDIAQAHVLGLTNIDKNPAAAYNLGNGKGFTILEVLEAVQKAAKKKIPYEFSARRPGDPDHLVASSSLARKELGWRPVFDSIDEIVRSAWHWHRRHPDGY